MTDIEYQRMNLPRRFWTATWNNLNVSLQEMVKKYVSEAFASKTGKGLLLYGEEGRGKCIHKDSMMYVPDGRYMSMENFVRGRVPEIITFDEVRQVYKVSRVLDWIDSGVKPCFLVRTRSGRKVIDRKSVV